MYNPRWNQEMHIFPTGIWHSNAMGIQRVVKANEACIKANSIIVLIIAILIWGSIGLFRFLPNEISPKLNKNYASKQKNNKKM